MKDGYLVTWDNYSHPINDPIHWQFLRDQRDIEVNLGQYSPSFGPNVLPGMYSMPLGVIPKPHSDKLCLINDLSVGEFSCNLMIPYHKRSVRLDGMQVLGHALR